MKTEKRIDIQLEEELFNPHLFNEALLNGNVDVYNGKYTMI